MCPEMDGVLKGIAFAPEGRVAFKWCRLCDKHYARCKCESPQFYIVCGGVEMTMPLTDLLGHTVVPDLTKR